MSPRNDKTGRRASHRSFAAESHSNQEQRNSPRPIVQGGIQKGRYRKHENKGNVAKRRGVNINAPISDNKGKNLYRVIAKTVNFYSLQKPPQSEGKCLPYYPPLLNILVV